MHIHSINDREVVLSSVVPAAELRPGGYICGPFQFTVADLGMWCACWGVHGLQAMALTSELSIRFIRPAKGSTLWARIAVNAASRRSIVSTATLWTDDAHKLCAVAQGTYVMPRK